MSSVSFKYWNDCVDPEDLKLLWEDAAVRKEWADANECMDQKVHLSRDPDGHEYLTQVEMRAVATITVHLQRHFKSHMDPDMICALAEISSDRQLLAVQYDKKTKETKLGIMQISLPTAEWLVREMGYKIYNLEEDPHMLYKPFVNVYFGAAYLNWLFYYDGKERSEEYVIRAYKGGVDKATHKSTAEYFQRYLYVKYSLPPKIFTETIDDDFSPGSLSVDPTLLKADDGYDYWDSRVSQEDMKEMWENPKVKKEWRKSGAKHGKVRFRQDAEKRPYLSLVEVKAVAEIIIGRYYGTRGIKDITLAALADICSMRYVNGLGDRIGLMGIDFSTASRLYRETVRKEYKAKSVQDLYNPFVSMYFGASYLVWLSEFEGRQRSQEFIVQAYLVGPENVNLQETDLIMKKFQEAVSIYEKSIQGNCCIL